MYIYYYRNNCFAKTTRLSAAVAAAAAVEFAHFLIHLCMCYAKYLSHVWIALGKWRMCANKCSIVTRWQQQQHIIITTQFSPSIYVYKYNIRAYQWQFHFIPQLLICFHFSLSLSLCLICIIHSYTRIQKNVIKFHCVALLSFK